MARKQLRFKIVHSEVEAMRLSMFLGGEYEPWRGHDEEAYIIWYRG